MSDHILTTHTGSLPRPEDLIQMMWAKGDGIPVDEQALAERVATAVKNKWWNKWGQNKWGNRISGVR